MGSPLRAEEADAYDYLNRDTIPPINLVIEAALDALPKDIAELQDWNKRIRMSALLPQFEARYRVYENAERTYDRVNQEIRRSERLSQTDRNQANDSETLTRVANSGPLDGHTDTRYRNEYDVKTVSQNKEVYETRGPVSLPNDDRTIWRQDVSFIARWDLSEFVFHNDEMEAAQVARIIASFRIDYMQDVAKVYGKLREAVNGLSKGSQTQRWVYQRAVNAIILDTITEGYLSNYARGRGRQAGVGFSSMGRRGEITANGFSTEEVLGLSGEDGAGLVGRDEALLNQKRRMEEDEVEEEVEDFETIEETGVDFDDGFDTDSF